MSGFGRKYKVRISSGLTLPGVGHVVGTVFTDIDGSVSSFNLKPADGGEFADDSPLFGSSEVVRILEEFVEALRQGDGPAR